MDTCTSRQPLPWLMCSSTIAPLTLPGAIRIRRFSRGREYRRRSVSQSTFHAPYPLSSFSIQQTHPIKSRILPSLLSLTRVQCIRLFVRRPRAAEVGQTWPFCDGFTLSRVVGLVRYQNLERKMAPRGTTLLSVSSSSVYVETRFYSAIGADLQSKCLWTPLSF